VLESIARDIPKYVDGLAKKEAQKQPDVARQLGSVGVKDLRKELAEAAAPLASEIEAANGQINWLGTQRGARDVRSALFDFMYGPRVNRIAAILKRHGSQSMTTTLRTRKA
jgi:hypothetical protein